MAKVTSYETKSFAYYYDENKDCTVELPEVDVIGIFNAEWLPRYGKRHCDLIMTTKQDENRYTIYLIELRKTDSENDDSILDAISPDTFKDKALGSLEIFDKNVKPVFEKLKNSTNFQFKFIMVVGQRAMEVLGREKGIFDEMITNYGKTIRRNFVEARIKPSGSNVYASDVEGFEII